jgi:hypothetical protein
LQSFFGGAGFAYLSQFDDQYIVNEPLVRLFLSGFVDETARKVLLEGCVDPKTSTRGFVAEMFLPSLMKRWERVPLDNFLTYVSTKPADVPKSLLGAGWAFHDTMTAIPIRPQVRFWYCDCCIFSHRSLLFQEGKPEAVIMEAIKTYQVQVGGSSFLVGFLPFSLFCFIRTARHILDFPRRKQDWNRRTLFWQQFVLGFFLPLLFPVVLTLFFSLEFCVEVLMKIGETSQESNSAYFGLHSFLSWFPLYDSHLFRWCSQGCQARSGSKAPLRVIHLEKSARRLCNRWSRCSTPFSF